MLCLHRNRERERVKKQSLALRKEFVCLVDIRPCLDDLNKRMRTREIQGRMSTRINERLLLCPYQHRRYSRSFLFFFHRVTE